MRRLIGMTLTGVLTLALASSAPAAAETVSVHVQSKPTIRASVRVSFRAKPLPDGGYYYAVLVLKPYRRYTRAAPPPCATSSNMQRADYGYPRSDGQVSLSLAPARSAAGHWCRGGAYVGAIYAVPHAPPCEGRYPCRSEPYTPPSPCWTLVGQVVCGVVALPPQYRYPDGLPTPLAAGTTIAARFAVRFAAA